MLQFTKKAGSHVKVSTNSNKSGTKSTNFNKSGTKSTICSGQNSHLICLNYNYSFMKGKSVRVIIIAA